MEQEQSSTPYDFEHCPTRLDHYGPYHREDVLAAICVTRGNLTEMSALLGRRRSSVRDHVYANIDVKDVFDEVREQFLDEAEQAHNQLALAGDGPALRFILQTLGKERGYTTRVETTGKDGGAIEHITLDVGKLTTEELRAVKAAALLEPRMTEP